MSGAGRLAALVAAAYNTARLPADAVPLDLSTDVCAPPALAELADPAAALDAAVAEVFGASAWLTTPRGRVAEAAIAAALIGPGDEVLASEVYVTGAWSIAREGGVIVEIAGDVRERGAAVAGAVEGFDLARASERLACGRVRCIWLTTPRVLLGPRGGAIVAAEAIAELAALRDRLAPAAPIVVDATKLGEWSARSGIGAGARWLFDHVDIIALSGRKDAGGAPLGLIVARDPAWIAAIRGRAARVLGPGTHAPAGPICALARGLRRIDAAARARWSELDALARGLGEGGAPIAGWGGGALFLDAARALPRVPASANPAATLLALLYLRAGIRGLGTPAGAAGPALVRLSVRAHATWLKDHLAAILGEARGWSAGLVAAGPAPAPFLDPLRPSAPAAWAAASTWPEGPVSPSSAGPAVLGADPSAGLRAALRRRLGLDAAATIEPLYGPRRRLAELWTRLARPAARVVGDPELARLAAAWRRPARAAGCGDLLVAGPRDLDERGARRAPGDLLVGVVGAPASWPEALPRGSSGTVDAWLVEALADPGSGAPGLEPIGALVLPGGSPLASALAESVLFSAGAPGSGGVDDDVLAALGRALAAANAPAR